ncbi:MAG TPA: hypothetical protein PKW76_08700 [bacterium]|nr:hypothetical protein [bacterium]HPG45746.1 hypothetical protein [bacterium]HPM98027.1 hypothetical protein [bacterium]
MKLSKKAWKAPQVIVLTRSKPEESVLEHCKLIGVGLGYPDSINQNGCNDLPEGNCSNCQARSHS